MSEKHPLKVGLTVLIVGALLLFVGTYLLTLLMGKNLAIGGEKVAVVEVAGVILSAEEAIEELKKYEKDPSVKAIVVRIESPGGAVVPAQEIYEEVRRIRNTKSKHVLASMGNAAASGGYYIACGAEKIVANPGTITGSIGVIMETANFEGLMKKVGVENVVVKSGKLKDAGTPFREMTREERAVLQGVIDDVHAQFIDAVSAGRRMERAQVVELADGRIYSGRQAKELGLVDELGTLDDTIKLAAELAGIKGEPRVVKEEKKTGFLSRLFGEAQGYLDGASLVKRQTGLFYLFSY
ncbi:MAG: signal peptide peptidase SppA [Nitrospirota bacterium]|nr:signal peptide peptidase SppA [Nitrospirota bacterium]